MATVFAPTDPRRGPGQPMVWPGIDRWLHTEYEDELTPMSWDELAELRDAGWEIGSHTCSHPHLTHGRPPISWIARCARVASAILAARLGACGTLAYPYGSYDDRVVEAAGAAGYSAAATLPIGPKWNGDRLEYPRVGVYNIDDRRRFRAKVSPLVRRARATKLWTSLKPGRPVEDQQPF